MYKGSRIDNPKDLEKNQISNVLFIIPFLNIINRGIERSGFNLAIALKSYIDQVSILCWSPFGGKNTT